MQKNDDSQIEVLKSLPKTSRLQSAFELYEFARHRVQAEITRQNPSLSEEEINALTNERFS